MPFQLDEKKSGCGVDGGKSSCDALRDEDKMLLSFGCVYENDSHRARFQRSRDNWNKNFGRNFFGNESLVVVLLQFSSFAVVIKVK